jgi:hypothetical protein
MMLLLQSQKLVPRKLGFAALLTLLPLHAAVIGTSTAAPPLTVARVNAELPSAQRAPWLAYLERSAKQMRADKAALAAERVGMKAVPAMPKEGHSAKSLPVDRGANFYRSAEARALGDAVLSFQTPAGGWSKNLDFAAGPRLRGQSYTAANKAPVASPAGDFDAPADETWHYVGTLDNDATNTELHFLAELSAAFPGHDGDAYRASFLRGVEYLLNAQFPNGGWPQVWPLEGGYHDEITFNDDAVTESAMVLRNVAAAQREEVLSERAQDALARGEVVSCGACEIRAVEDYTFVPAALRARAAAAVERANALILATQLRDADGKLAIWAQQNDPLTLRAVAARNFEPAAFSSGESASVLEYLMTLPKPSPEVVRAVDSGVAWLAAHAIMGYVWTGGRSTPGGRTLKAEAGAGPLWARYYSLTTGKPIFGDRDKSIHDNVAELSLERRNGYGWFGSAPAQALRVYAVWYKNTGRKLVIQQ